MKNFWRETKHPSYRENADIERILMCETSEAMNRHRSSGEVQVPDASRKELCVPDRNAADNIHFGWG
jgi:hypothetical protein